MKTTTAYYRVPAVIFAVLVGGLFVYAKAGGRFLTPGKPTPAAAASESDPSLPRIEFMMGPKSAPAFLPEEPPTIHATPRQLTSAPPSSTLLPGSKSAGVVAPESLLPQQAVYPSPTGAPTNVAPFNPAQSNTAPTNTAPSNTGPTNVAPTGPRLLPGSKSIILVDPSTLRPLQAPVQQAAPPPPTNAVQPRSLLPGSKSRAVVDPAALLPQRQPVQSGVER